METSTILLLVAVAILIYVIFFAVTGAQSLNAKTDLAVAQTPIPATALTSPESSTYSYSMWVYVYGPKEQLGNGNKYIISRVSPKQSSGSTTDKNIGLLLDATSPSLKLEYTSTSTSGATQTTTLKKPLITDNFPLQSWVHVIISVQDNYIDCYLNGKLIKSINDNIDTPSGSTDLVYGQIPAHLAKFERTTKATDPQTAWDLYTSGNGENPLKKYMANIGMSVNFSKDGKDKYQITVI